MLVREIVRPRWAPFRLPAPSLDGLTRRRGDGLVRLLHVDGAPVVVAVSGVVFAARAATEELAREGIARIRFATGIDDDLAEFHARFRDDPRIGKALRARPWLRVRRTPDPWETLVAAITEQLIDMERAVAIQRRLIRAFGRGYAGLRDGPSAETIAGAAPAELEACGLAAKRAVAMRRAASEVAAGRIALTPAAHRGPLGDDPALARLRSIPEIGTWTLEMLALHGLGRLDVVPAGDLGFLKLVGRIATGNPKAIADEAEVRAFFEPYAPWAGLAGSYLLLSRGLTRPALLPEGTRWSAAGPRRARA